MNKFLVLMIVLLPMFTFSQQKDNRIKIDQLGYLPSALKRAVVPSDRQGEFTVIDTESGKAVYKGKTTKPAKWEFSGEKVCIADFSKFKTPGTYKLHFEDGKQILDSYPFTVSDNVYDKEAKASVFALYLARVSFPIEEKYAGKYARPAGHPDTHVLVHKSAADKNRPEGTVISSPGGWYDAGDYNKYIVNSGITTYMLLHFVELYPKYSKSLNLNIPESSNSLPDIVDETLWNLRWMLTMQDPNDGGVYHKLTNKNFCGDIMPHKATAPRYVVGKSTSAALDFAAVCAKAYRVFQPYEELHALADTCLTASKRAYEWAKNHSEVYFKNPDDITTGQYDDDHLSDEFMWAGTELYLSTNDKSFVADINYKDPYWLITPSWRKVGMLGLYSLFTEKSVSDKVIPMSYLKKSFLDKAKSIYNKYENSAYGVSLSLFEWGSNSQSVNEAILLIHAYKLTGEKKYFNAATAILNYINGTNPLDICYVTGFGTINPQDIHDRRSRGDTIDSPIPGYMVGGPNYDAGEDCGKDAYLYKEPAARYVDRHCSYSTNEIAINWNAVLIFLVNSVRAENKDNK